MATFVAYENQLAVAVTDPAPNGSHDHLPTRSDAALGTDGRTKASAGMREIAVVVSSPVSPITGASRRHTRGRARR